MIHISKKLILQIKGDAEKAYPNECCGFIFGRLENGEKYAQRIASSANSAERAEQYHRFKITPEDMLKAERFARLNDWDIVGFYHSHPDCPAVPSEYDTSHALPVYSYMIISAMNGKAENCTSWELDKESNYKKFLSEVTDTSKGEDH